MPQVRHAGENPRLYAALETEVPRAAVADAQGAIQDDFLPLSSAYLESNRDLLRPKAPVPFVAEFLARRVHGLTLVTANTHDFSGFEGLRVRNWE